MHSIKIKNLKRVLGTLTTILGIDSTNSIKSTDCQRCKDFVPSLEGDP